MLKQVFLFVQKTIFQLFSKKIIYTFYISNHFAYRKTLTLVKSYRTLFTLLETEFPKKSFLSASLGYPRNLPYIQISNVEVLRFKLFFVCQLGKYRFICQALEHPINKSVKQKTFRLI